MHGQPHIRFTSDLCSEGALFAYRQWHYISGQTLLLFFSHSRTHNSMQHSYSSETSGFTAIEGIPACYGTQTCSSMFPTARHFSSWARSIHSTSLLWMKIQFNVIIPSNTRSLKWSFSLKSPHQNPVCTLPVSHTCYMLRPSHPSSLDPPNNTWWAV